MATSVLRSLLVNIMSASYMRTGCASGSDSVPPGEGRDFTPNSGGSHVTSRQPDPPRLCLLIHILPTSWKQIPTPRLKTTIAATDGARMNILLSRPV